MYPSCLYVNATLASIHSLRRAEVIIGFIDHGIQGHTFPIKERSLLEVIQERLAVAEKSGELQRMQEVVRKRVIQKVQTPPPVPGIRHAREGHVFYHDPTYRLDQDLKDAKGRVFVKKGTTVNPLEFVKWGQQVVLIDGEEESHVTWALSQKEAKIMLVKGSPLKLSQEHGISFYFDQGGILTRRLGISHVPAVISQADLWLKIEEVLL